MTTKKEISDALNNLLDVDISWDRLRKESLIELVVMFKHPEILISKLMDSTDEVRINIGSGGILKMLDGWDGPVVNRMKKVLTSDEDETDKS